MRACTSPWSVTPKRGVSPALDLLPLSSGSTCAIIHYRGNVRAMTIAHSKLTAQGQISVPANVRRKLGVGPGSVLEWHEEGDRVVVRRAGRYSSEEVHRALFPKGHPKPRTLEELKAGVRRYQKKRHAVR
jgi:AbrB family looped-hinge helix DNA binding protein